MAARVLPLTVTTPGSTCALTIAPLTDQSEGDSNATWVRLPTAASGRMRNDRVRTGGSAVAGSVVMYEMAT